MQDNLTDRFIEELEVFGKTPLEPNTVAQAKNCFLDYLGATLAGSRMIQEKGDQMLSFFEAEGQSKVIGFAKRAGLMNAAFINGVSSHVAELDDGVISGIIHPGSPIISAMLPVAESKRIDGLSFLKALVIGYEASVRIAESIQPNHKLNGYHATATCGSIGAAIAISTMLGYSRDQLKSSISAACISAAGTLKALEDESQLKPYNVGYAALNAIAASSMGYSGFNPPNDVFQGNRGFFTMMSERFDESALFNNGNKLAVERVYVKPYAACRYCHPSIDAVFNITKDKRVDPTQIESINIRTYKWAVEGHDHTEIKGISSAKMSIPYSVAVAIIDGKAGLDQFSNSMIENSQVKELSKKISVHSDQKLTAEFPSKSAASLEIVLRDGTVLKDEVDNPKGEPVNPLNENELLEKFKSLAVYGGKNEKEAHSIIKYNQNLEEDISILMELL